MTNTNTVEWGNIELPGLSDDVLFNSHHLSNVLKFKNESSKEKLAETVSRLHEDPNGPYAEWYKGRTNMKRDAIVASNKMRDKEKQSKACREAILKKWQDPVYRSKQEEKSKGQMKKIQDPDGNVFLSRKAAAEFYKTFPQTVSKWVKQNKGWRYL